MLKWGDSMIGLNHSVKTNMILIGDIEFPKLITDAVISGVGYISIPLNSNYPTPQESIKGKEVMNRFLNCIKASKGNMNAFGLDIIEKMMVNIYYLLCIYQEQELLLDRLIPKEIRKYVNSLLSVVPHYKKIDTKK